MLELWPELGEAAVAGEELWFRVRRWTHVAGSQMAPHPSRERHGVRGQLHQYNLPTPLLDLWSVERLLCTLAIEM